jgi:hypothetical protein
MLQRPFFVPPHCVLARKQGVPRFIQQELSSLTQAETKK